MVLQDNTWISPLLKGRTKQHSVKIAVFMYALHANYVVSTARNRNSSFHKHPGNEWYPPQVLNLCADEMSKSLFIIYKKSIEEGRLLKECVKILE